MAESHTAENDLEPLNPTHATAESSEGDHAKVEEKSAETGLDINNYMRIASRNPLAQKSGLEWVIYAAGQSQAIRSKRLRYS